MWQILLRKALDLGATKLTEAIQSEISDATKNYGNKVTKVELRTPDSPPAGQVSN